MPSKALEVHLQILQKYLHKITELCINSPNEMFVEINNKFIHHDFNELTYEYLESLSELVAEYNNQTISPEKPLLSATLPGGERAQFVIPPACEPGHVICSIRKHQMRDMTLDGYVTSGAFDSVISQSQSISIVDDELKRLYQEGNWIEFIKTAVLGKKNIIISGGTGTGKTTFLNACLKLIPDTERLITIEDTREVQVTQQITSICLQLKASKALLKLICWIYLNVVCDFCPIVFFYQSCVLKKPLHF